MTNQDLTLLTDEERAVVARYEPEPTLDHHEEYLAAKRNVYLLARELASARAEIGRLREMLPWYVRERRENRRLWKLLRKVTETLIWASGAFQSKEESAAWAEHGRPVLDELRALLQSEKGGE